MPPDPRLLGVVQDVSGSTISVSLQDATQSGLTFVDGHPYHVSQVGSFVRIPLGLTDLVGIVSHAGAAPVTNDIPEEFSLGRMWLTVQLVGEGAFGRTFTRGVSLLPSIGDSVYIMTEANLEAVYGQAASRSHVSIGRVASASSIPALLDINSLVTRHSAIVGTTGSGKSTTVVRILESMTDRKRYPSARVLVFDLHGEYASALQDQAQTFRVQGEESGAMALNIPYWALSFEELIPLTFGQLPDDASRGHVRDEIVRLKREALERFPREGVDPSQVTVDTPIPFSVHELWFILHRLLNATHTLAGANQSQETEALLLGEDGKALELGDPMRVVPPRYRSATQAAGQQKVFLSSSTVTIRRQLDALASRLRDRRYDFLFRPGTWTAEPGGKVDSDLANFLMDWLGDEHTVSILDLSGVPTEVLTDVIGALTRLIYDALFWSRQLSEGGRERPLLMVFEEAHAYLGKEQDHAVKVAVQRVVKEGRKYGVGAMVVSQRPSEVDATILSQCGTVIALRLANAKDRGHVISVVADNLGGVLSLLPILRTGEAIVVGEAVPIPMRVLVDRPRYLPESKDPQVAESGLPGGWDRNREPADYNDVVARWRSQDISSARIVRHVVEAAHVSIGEEEE